MNNENCNKNLLPIKLTIDGESEWLEPGAVSIIIHQTYEILLSKAECNMSGQNPNKKPFRKIGHPEGPHIEIQVAKGGN